MYIYMTEEERRNMTEEERRLYWKSYWKSVKDGEELVKCYNPRNHDRESGTPCELCTQDCIEMMTFKPDIGPWIVSEDGRSLQSDDFKHDVALAISGDFFDDELRKQYAQHIADILNAAPGVRALDWFKREQGEL